MTTNHHRLPGLAAIVACCLGLLGAPRTASAQSVEAETLFNDGNRLMTEGKLAAACDAFEASNRIESRAGTLIRLGECREQNGQLAFAWSAYKDALTRVKDARKKAIARAKVTALEAKLSTLTVAVADPAGDKLVVTRNGEPLDRALWNLAVPVNGGDYEIVATAPAKVEWRKTVNVPVASGTISVSVPALQDAPLAAPDHPATDHPTAPTHTATTATHTPPTSTHGSPPLLTGRRKLALGVAAGGAVAVTLGIVFGVQANGLQRDARSLCPDRLACSDPTRANDLISSAQSRALAANIAYGVGGAAVIAAGVLWFTGSAEHAPPRTAIAPAVGPGTTGIVVVGSF